MHPPDEPPARLAAGVRVGSAVLETRLGGGGMGDVWRAADASRGGPVAVKFLHVDDPQALARFLREAKIAQALDHPNIAKVYEVGEHDGLAFLVQQYVDGTSLDGHTLERDEAVRVLRDAVSALAHAHARQFIHRDIKPGNLVRTPDGRTVVIDFGLARAIEQTTHLTRTGTVLGTPQYMAPEQAMGHAADPRSDIYGLGATLYALICGRPPVTGANAADVVRRVATLDPNPLPESDDLARIVNRMMRRERDRRYPDAQVLLADVEALAQGRPISDARKKSFLARWFGR